MTRGAAGLVVLLAFPVLGCSGGDDGPAVAPTVHFDAPATADGTPPENLALPLTSLLRGAWNDGHLISQAAYAVTSQCMAEQGFEPPPFDDSFPGYGVDHPFGPWTDAEVADGYGGADTEPRSSLYEQFVATLPPSQAHAWGEAYSGPGLITEGPFITVTMPDGSEKASGFVQSLRDGCDFQGSDAVYGDYAYREELRQEIEELVNEAFVDAEDDDDVEQALDVWQQCLEAQGVDADGGADGPTQLMVDYVTEPGVDDEERQVASLDVGCKAEANLHDAYFVARAAAEQELIEDNQLYVEAWRELVTESLERAREIVAGDDG